MCFREDQCISVCSGADDTQAAMVPYDYLVLCTGTQFIKPAEAKVSPHQLLFTINSEHDASALLEWVHSELLQDATAGPSNKG